MATIEIDETPDRGALKYTTDEGFEVICKQAPCGGKPDGKLRVFIDTSVGCQYRCNYCWLAKTKVRRIDPAVRASALWKAVEEAELLWGFQPKQAVRLKLMGQGDCLARGELSVGELLWHYQQVVDIEHVSASSIFPCDTTLYVWDLDRVYVSVGSFVPEKRDRILPDAAPLDVILELLGGHRDARLHYTPTNRLQMPQELAHLIEMQKTTRIPHIRIVPYNRQPNSDIRRNLEVGKFLKALQELEIPHSVLDSHGHAIQAACGMFG